MVGAGDDSSLADDSPRWIAQSDDVGFLLLVLLADRSLSVPVGVDIVNGIVGVDKGPCSFLSLLLGKKSWGVFIDRRFDKGAAAGAASTAGL